MYEPKEDSFLLLRNIKNNIESNSRVLDMGTGSGILAKEASKHAKEIVAIDIDKRAIRELEKKEGDKNISFVHSNLFSKVKGKFDLILFNPPYLPSTKIRHIDIEGGENGTEIIDRFLKQAKSFLDDNGKILLLCSSLNKKIEDMFEKYKYNFKKIDQEPLFFEKLFVYELK